MGRERTERRNNGSVIKKLLIPVAIAAVIIAGAIFFINSGIGQKGKVITYGADSKTAFRIYDGGFLQYTKDGITYYGSSGNKTWTDSYGLTTPIAVSRGDYTALYESEGRNVRVYNEDGPVYNVQTSDTIAAVSVAENGYIGVITGGDADMVSVYNTSGNMLFQRVEADSGVYPLCCDISPDGAIIAISYMDTTGVGIESMIGMFYISADEGADYTDSMFSAVTSDDNIIFKLYFMSDSGLVAIGDRHIIRVSRAGVEENTVDVTNEITGVGLCGNKIALAYGDEMPDREGEEPGTIMFVSSNGNISAGYSIGTEADYFMTSDGGAVMGSGTSYYGINDGGKLEWQLNTSGNVTGIYPTDNVRVCVYAARTWAVMEDMSGFDTMEYDPGLISMMNQANTVEPETVAEPEETETTEDSTEETETTENEMPSGGENSSAQPDTADTDGQQQTDDGQNGQAGEDSAE